MRGAARGAGRREVARDDAAAWPLAPPLGLCAKLALASFASLTRNRLRRNWFTNARRRIWKPLVKSKLDAPVVALEEEPVEAEPADDSSMECAGSSAECVS